MDDLVEQVKQANPIEVVVAQTYELGRRVGSKYRARKHDSLVVDAGKQMFYWNSKNLQGDVITFVMSERRMDFKEAVEWLADKVGIQVKWAQNGPIAAAMREREEVWAAACQVWAAYLWNNPAAISYARGRGFDDETIRTAGLGYTGGPGMIKDMLGELKMRNIDTESPAAVCVLGYRGDVSDWAQRHQVSLQDNSDWIDWGMIPGAMGRERLVYPHMISGRVKYFSTRAILDGRKFGGEGEAKKEIQKSWNPPRALGGLRAPFFNQVYDRLAPGVVVVEGPADAITLGMWGYSSVALCGVTMRDQEGMGLLRTRLKGHQGVYVAMDGDKAGQAALMAVAEMFGPLARLVRWPVEVEAPEFHPQANPTADDELLEKARAVAEEMGGEATISQLQKRLRIGYVRASRLKDRLDGGSENQADEEVENG